MINEKLVLLSGKLKPNIILDYRKCKKRKKERKLRKEELLERVTKRHTEVD